MKAAQEREAQQRHAGRPAPAADDTDAEPGTGAADVSPKRPRKTRRS